MKSFLKIFLLILLLAFVVIQFFGIDKSVPQHDPATDFITVTNPPADVESILRQACYDCHSYETEYPWYSNIQPVGWWLGDHIEHGRHHLNFSTWADDPQDRQSHKLEELGEEVDEKKMPLDSYTWAHTEARLTDDQRETLVTWANDLRTTLEMQVPDSLSGEESPQEPDHHHEDGHDHEH